MSKWQKVPFSSFLTERKNRFKPKEATALGLKRVDKINFSAEIFISDKPTNTDMILVKKGDLLISGINAEKGAIAVYEGNDDVLASIHYSSYQFDKKKINIDFLKWFLISDAFRRLLKEQTGGGIKTELKAKHILPLQIDLPDLETQKEIVKTISVRNKNYSEFFSELTTQQNLLTQLRQSILQEAVQGKLVKQNKNDEPASELLKRIKAEKEKLIKQGKLKKEKPLLPIAVNEIPYEVLTWWAWVRFGEIVRSISTGPFGTMLHKSDYVENGIPLVNPMNIVDGKIIPSGKMNISPKTRDRLKSYILKTGDIVIGRRGEMGRCAVVTEKEHGWLCGTGSFFLELEKSIDTNYFIKVFTSKFCLDYLNSFSVGATMSNLNHGILNNMLFPLPPLSEQKRIVEKVNQLMQHCNELEQQVQQSISHAQQLMRAVLREVFERKKEYKVEERVSLAAEG